METWDWGLKFYKIKNKYSNLKIKIWKIVSKSIFKLQKENLKKINKKIIENFEFENI